jgi:hypothetical protein
MESARGDGEGVVGERDQVDCLINRSWSIFEGMKTEYRNSLHGCRVSPTGT